MRIYRVLAVALLALAAAAPMALQAQTWPARPVKLIVPFPPGGTADLLGRLAAKEMEASLGQPVVVENRAGAGGAIGSDAAAKAAPDGYTLVLSNVASHGIGPSVYAKLPYDALRDFTHIGLIAAVPSGIAVAANGPYTSLAALLDKARKAPGAVRFGSNGNGTSSHVKLAILNRAARVDITHVPYKGSAPATADLAGGQIDGLIAAVPDVGPEQSPAPAGHHHREAGCALARCAERAGTRPRAAGRQQLVRHFRPCRHSGPRRGPIECRAGRRAEHAGAGRAFARHGRRTQPDDAGRIHWHGRCRHHPLGRGGPFRQHSR